MFTLTQHFSQIAEVEIFDTSKKMVPYYYAYIQYILCILKKARLRKVVYEFLPRLRITFDLIFKINLIFISIPAWD